MTDLKLLCRRVVAAGTLGLAAAHLFAQTGDYIVAVVNQELVTASEVQQRLARMRDEAARNKQTLPPLSALRKQVVETLIDERVLVTNARENGSRVDDPEIDRAVLNVATQNQMTLPQLRERLRQEGIPFAKFRDNIRDQIMVERVREREVVSRIRITDAEIDELIEKRRGAAGASAQINVAQILVTVPDGSAEGVVAERRGRAEAALKRVRAGEDFAAVAREISEDSNRSQGGEIGMRPVDRLPDLFARAAQASQARRSRPGADPQRRRLPRPQARRSPGVGGVHRRPVARAAHPAAAFGRADARRRRRAACCSSSATSSRAPRTFEQLARENSEDASAAQGGDLGWTAPGSFVPEFEEAMTALPVGGISDPVTTRFGVHLIQVVDRRQTTIDIRQLREQARNILREQKFEAAFTEWLRDLRGRAYVEYREPPQ